MQRVQLACVLGTGFEFFEFQLFALLMPIWVSHFFSPTITVSDRYLAGYLLFSVAFAARLLGAMGLGFLADHVGRRTTLFTAMWIMALSTGFMACLPVYAQVGGWALGLLMLCRLGQGFSLGGEFAIGGVLLFENQARPSCLGLIWQDLGGCGGLFIATLLVSSLFSLFSSAQIELYAWRLPLFFAFLISLGVIFLRARVPDPALQQGLLAINQYRSNRQYYLAVSQYARVMGLLVCCCCPNGIFWYLQVVYIPQQIMTLSETTLLALIALTLITIPLGAICADRLGKYRVWACSVVLLVMNFNCFILSGRVQLQVIGLIIQAVLLALNQGPRLFIMNSHFPLSVRALACSLVYSGANVMGGLAPFISLWLLDITGSNRALGWLLMSIGVLSLSAMYWVMDLKLGQKNVLGEEKNEYRRAEG